MGRVTAALQVRDSSTPALKLCTALEKLCHQIIEHGKPHGDGVRLIVNVPARTSVGSSIPGLTDRFFLDTHAGAVWVHSSRTTYLAGELDALRWLVYLEAVS